MLKRIFDLFFSILGLLILFIPFILVAIFIGLDSRGGIFYRQVRVGKNGKDFYLLKFRSMKSDSDKEGLLTVGGRDARITRVGYFIRKYKIDELPQLFNVVSGEMSLVGPRPEVRKYVNMYTAEQLKVLDLKPGITDMASIVFRNENEMLGRAEDSEKVYVEEILPLKLKLNLKYIEQQSLWTDFMIIMKTFTKIIK